MDKTLAKLLAEANAPIIALLMEINNKLNLLNVVSGVSLAPTVTPDLPVAPTLTETVHQSATAASQPASKITREELGQSFLTFARSSDENLAKAQSLITKYVPAEEATKTLAFVPVDKYSALSADLQALINAPLAKVAESLI